MTHQQNKAARWQRVDSLATRWAAFVLTHRWLTIGMSLLVAAVFSAGLMQLEVSNNYRVFFSDQNPDLQQFQKFEDTYTKNDNILFILKPRQGDIRQPSVMSATLALTEQSWSVPFAIRVDSLTNFQHTYADGDELIVEDLIEDPAALSAEALAERVGIAHAEPLLHNRLIADDYGATGVNVTLQFPGESLTEVPQAIGFARELAAKLEADYPDLEVAISGVTALNAAFAEATVNDAKTLFGPMFLVLVFITWLIVRSVTATLATVLVINLATMVAVGFAGWAGITFSPFSGSAPVVILSLAIADSIHILITVVQRMRKGDDKLTALTESIRVNFLAVSITSVTTIIGFLALNFSDAPPFHALGNISAVGIAAAWFFSLTFFPALLSLMPFSVKAEGKNDKGGLLTRAINRVAELVIARTKTTLVGVTVLLVALVAAIPRIDLNDQWIEYFDHRIAFRGDAEFALEHLTGLYVLEYSIPAGDTGAVNEPAYLQRLEDFTLWLRDQQEVVHVYSYTDIIKRLNKNMHFDNDAYYRLPDDRDLSAQYLLLYELSLPYGLDMNDRIDVSKSSTRVTVTLEELTTRETREFLNRVDGWWQQADPQTKQYATAATYLFSFISERNIQDMIGGNVIAVALIALIMVFALGSLKYGALSLIPNLAPLAMTFGVWAVLVGQVGMAAATVSATSLGIIVDNTVHILTKFLRARRELRLSSEDAVRYAMDTVGAAVAANAIILAIGFSVLAFSSFKITAQMGTLTALAILIALVVDFLLLPALLLIRQSSQTVGEHHDSYPSSETA